MPRRYPRAAAFLVAAIVAFPFASAGADPCTEAGGPFTSTLVPPPDCTSPIGVCTIGALDGRHDETYFFVMDTLVPSPDLVPGKFVYTGHSLITRTHGGATLIGQDSGFIFMDVAPAPFVTTVNIVGGTKQFAHATGQYVATGKLDFITGAAVGAYTSNVCK
jgi:hypothetical protein